MSALRKLGPAGAWLKQEIVGFGGRAIGTTQDRASFRWVEGRIVCLDRDWGWRGEPSGSIGGNGLLISLRYGGKVACLFP